MTLTVATSHMEKTMPKTYRFTFYEQLPDDDNDNVLVQPKSIRDKCEHEFRQKNCRDGGWPRVCKRCGQAARAEKVELT